MSSERSESLFKELLSFAFPPLCAGCGSFCDDSAFVCDNCRAAIDWFTSPFYVDYHVPGKDSDHLKLFAGAEYLDPIKSIVVAFKFNGVTSVVPFLVERLLEQHRVALEKLGDAVLVPIPLHPSREYHRGYNQATLLAQEFGRRLDWPMNDTAIERTRIRRPQSRLREASRFKNIKGVFAVDEEELDSLEGRKIVLVDDVVTSGATIGEAASVLSRAGLEIAGAIAVAHGL